MHFHYVAIISIWKRTWFLIWTKFNFFLNCCIIFVKFHWNWLSAWFGRETYLNLSMYCAKFNWTKLNGQKGIGKVYLSFQVWWAKLHFWTTTHHYGNNLPGIAVIPCVMMTDELFVASLAASSMTGRSIWSISLHD